MRFPFLFLFILALPGCATIVQGSTQSIAVSSVPPSASCTIEREGARLASITETPGNITVPRHKAELVVTCNKTGYATASKTIPSSVNAITYGNILLGGPIGSLVDMNTGARYGYPDTIEVELVPMANPTADADPTANRSLANR